MELDKALKKFLIKEPFYGLFCLGLGKEETDKIPTLAVERSGINVKLLFNKNFWESLNGDEQIAVLKHELKHICFQHMFISESFSDKKLFNIAADLEVNCGIDNLPQGALLCKDYHFAEMQGVKYYYEQLSQQQQQQSGGQGNPSDSQQENGSGGQQTLDDHSGWKNFENMSSAEKQLTKNQLDKMLVDAAEQTEKSRGTIPGELSAIIEKLKKKKPRVFDWKQYFRRLLGTSYDVNIKSTRRRESKRFEDAMGIIHRKKVEILVAIDTSASVNNKELAEFFNEIDYIHKAGGRVTIIECDTQINRQYEYKGKFDGSVMGRGGTDFDPVIDYYVDHRREYSTLVYFTDGECNLPKKRPNNMIWIITSNGMKQEYPGKTVYIPNYENS